MQNRGKSPDSSIGRLGAAMISLDDSHNFVRARCLSYGQRAGVIS
jgi:hypothetical protein